MRFATIFSVSTVGSGCALSVTCSLCAFLGFFLFFFATSTPLTSPGVLMSKFTSCFRTRLGATSSSGPFTAGFSVRSRVDSEVLLFFDFLSVPLTGGSLSPAPLDLRAVVGSGDFLGFLEAIPAASAWSGLGRFRPEESRLADIGADGGEGER